MKDSRNSFLILVTVRVPDMSVRVRSSTHWVNDLRQGCLSCMTSRLTEDLRDESKWAQYVKSAHREQTWWASDWDSCFMFLMLDMTSSTFNSVIESDLCSRDAVLVLGMETGSEDRTATTDSLCGVLILELLASWLTVAPLPFVPLCRNPNLMVIQGFVCGYKELEAGGKEILRRRRWTYHIFKATTTLHLHGFKLINCLLERVRLSNWILNVRDGGQEWIDTKISPIAVLDSI